MLTAKVSLHIGKKYNVRHNLRDYDKQKWNKDGHIDDSRSTLNEVLVNTDLREFFDDTFGEAIANFNEKNKSKHPDRVIDVKQYFQEQKSKVQECIIQLGDHSIYTQLVGEIGQEKADEFYKNALHKAFEKWQEDNPSLRAFCGTIHMDEQTPHLHIDYLPVAETTRGLTVKVSLEGALKQLGFSRSKNDKFDETPFKRWLADRRQGFENFFQEKANELLGKDAVKILPSEPTTKPHQETWQHRETQKGLAKVADFVTQKGAKKIAAAEEIIENVEKVKQAICTENALEKEQLTKDRQRLEARKVEVEEAAKINAENQKIIEKNMSIIRENDKRLKSGFANLKATVEREVQRRLARLNPFKKQIDENDRYKQRIQQIQEAAEKAAQKRTKGDFER